MIINVGQTSVFLTRDSGLLDIHGVLINIYSISERLFLSWYDNIIENLGISGKLKIFFILQFLSREIWKFCGFEWLKINVCNF